MADKNIIFGEKALAFLTKTYCNNTTWLWFPLLWSCSVFSVFSFVCLFCLFFLTISQHTQVCCPLDYQIIDTRSHSLCEKNKIKNQPPSVPQESDPLHVTHVQTHGRQLAVLTKSVILQNSFFGVLRFSCSSQGRLLFSLEAIKNKKTVHISSDKVCLKTGKNSLFCHGPRYLFIYLFFCPGWLCWLQRERVTLLSCFSKKTSLKRFVSLSRVCRRGIGLRVHLWTPQKQKLYRAKSPGCHGLSPPVRSKQRQQKT